MFNFIRRYRNFFSIIFVLAAVGMVISLFGTGAGGGGGGGFMNAGSAAKVMNQRVTIGEFAQAFDYRWKEAQAAMERQFKGEKTDPQTKIFLQNLIKSQVSPQNVLNQLIQQRYMTALSSHHGLKVPPEAIRYLLTRNPVFQKDGKFDPLLYKQYVRRPGDYENQLKDQLHRDALFYNFAIPTAVLSKAAQKEAELLKQNFTFQLLEVKTASVNAPSASKSQVEEFAADPAAQQELEAYYQSHRMDYESPAQVRAAHILFNELNGGAKKAAEVRSQIESGKLSFEAAAKQFSADKSNSAKGGDLGFFEFKTMDPKFSEAAFALNEKQKLSGVIQTSFGHHIIQYMDKKEAVTKTLEDVRTALAKRFLDEKAKKDLALNVLSKAAKSGKLSASDQKRLGTKWEANMDWTPLDDSVGVVSVSNLDLKALLNLQKPGEFYPRVIPQGQSLFLLKLEKRSKVESNPTDLIASNVSSSIQYYLDSNMKKLEEEKKIYRNEEILAQFAEQLKTL